ncbi:unnamed protein product [Rhizoctonia solani]|uniref:DUF4203 domain-containing protein n=1 Tax=Rhizoctonia solani TaxID=456999 RepID=A0A8H3APB7_9AGAM|nr:unnamed protein product [Rhizoctonia solani]
MMRTSNFVTVSTLLRSPYHLVYALPLLFLSILLLFAGTFLTLDRTRSFASSSDVKKAAPFYRLDSGIGGLAIGWVLGVHTTTLISLLILNQTETARLSAPAFLAIWLLSAIILTFVCGRWKYAALALGGILGGACTGLILAISLHPSLLARLVLTLVVTMLLTGGALLPFPVVRHASLRISTSATGAVGVINACAILGSSTTENKLAGWSNAWLHLVLLHDSDSAELQWGTGRSKGLTAACFFLWMIGAACDWYLKRRVGEDPEEAWDNVLGSYAAAFPPETSRAGNFTPIKSHWAAFKEKLHSSKTTIRAEKTLLFPSDSQLAPTLPKFRQDPKAPPVFRPRVPGTFSPDPYYSDSDSDLGEGEKPSRRVPNERKWTGSTNYSDVTLVNSEGSHRHHGIVRTLQRPPILIASPSNSHIEYGDKDAERSPELNLGPHRIEPAKDDEESWRPVFLKRSDTIKSVTAEMAEVESRDVTTLAPAVYAAEHPSGSLESAHRGTSTGTPMYALASGSSSTPGLVPATPSLIRALDRVSKAQRQAYVEGPISDMAGGSARDLPSNNSGDARYNVYNESLGPRENDRWRGFWNSVQQKAAEP